MLYLGRTARPGTGGAGKYRGGNGLESVRLVWKSRDAVFQHVGHGMVHVNTGMFGGYPSNTGYRRSVHDTDAFERIKMQIRAADIYAADDVASLARRYGAGLTSGLTVEDIEAWPDLLDAVTEDDILAAAERVFDRTNAVT